MKDQLVNALLDAQSLNAREARALFDPSPEVDSAVEHLLVLARTATAEQRPHVRALVGLIGEVRQLNAMERESERAAAALVDPVSSVHEFVKLARPLLADLLNPVFSDRRKARRLGELHALFARTLPRTRSAFSCRPLLGSPAKYGELLVRLEEWEQLVAVECAA